MLACHVVAICSSACEAKAAPAAVTDDRKRCTFGQTLLQQRDSYLLGKVRLLQVILSDLIAGEFCVFGVSEEFSFLRELHFLSAAVPRTSVWKYCVHLQ